MSVAEAAMPLEALRYCRGITRHRARNFYYGLKLLPEPKRSALYAVYAWMRRADDIADEGDAEGAKRRQRLRDFHRRTLQTLDGAPPGDEPLWIALRFAVDRFALPREPFEAQLAGQHDDLEPRAYQTFDELREYCRRVASTVGLLSIQIWGYTDHAARHLAVERGIALQLTNMIRDFGRDLDQGRIYLPLDEMAVHGLDPWQLRSWQRPAACRDFFLQQIERAASYYERSAGLEALISSDCRPTLWAMTRIYWELLSQAAADPRRIVGPRRIRLSSWHKAGIAFHAMFRSERIGAAPRRFVIGS